MTLVKDGLFYHPDGGAGPDVLARMVDGTTNYRLDNPFKPAFDETRTELDRLERQIFNTKQRLISLEHEQQRLIRLAQEQEAAVARHAETGEIDPILVPSVDKIAAKRLAKQKEQVKAELEFQLPEGLVGDGWSQKTVQVTDTEVLVTISKPRADNPTHFDDEVEAVAKAVELAMQPFETDGAHFYRFKQRRVATTPQQSSGPPDD